MKLALLLLVFALPALSGQAKDSTEAFQTGTASWYTEGTKTASGERYNPSAMTAAHRTLPMGTIVEVQNLSTGRCVKVRISDRGPYCKGRIIDVSKAAAQQLKMIQSGTAKVKIALLK